MHSYLGSIILICLKCICITFVMMVYDSCSTIAHDCWSYVQFVLLRHVCREWALLSFHSVCLSVCHTTKFGRQVYTCPRTGVSLFGSPISHTFGARGKNMQNFAYCVFLPLWTWHIMPYDLFMLLLLQHYITLFLCWNCHWMLTN